MSNETVAHDPSVRDYTDTSPASPGRSMRCNETVALDPSVRDYTDTSPAKLGRSMRCNETVAFDPSVRDYADTSPTKLGRGMNGALSAIHHSTTMSSRWTISSRPRKPRRRSISALLRPAMRRASSAA